MKGKVFKIVKILESLLLLACYAALAAFLFYQAFYSDEMKELGLMYLLVFPFVAIGGLACASCSVLSLMAMGFIGLAKERSKLRCGFLLACITKALVVLFLLCWVVYKWKQGVASFWWAIPMIPLFATMAATDLAFPRKLQLL